MNTTTTTTTTTTRRNEREQNGYAIRAIRQLQNKTADDLAHDLLVSTPLIWAYENEHRNCPAERLVKIAETLKVDVRALARRSDFGIAA